MWNNNICNNLFQQFSFFSDKQHLPLALLITSTTSHGNKLYPVHLFRYYNETGKDKTMPEIRRDEVYSRILQEMSIMDNFISRKIKVVYHRNCYRKYTSKQNCSVFKTDQIFFYKYWTSFNYVTHKYCNTLPVRAHSVGFLFHLSK